MIEIEEGPKKCPYKVAQNAAMQAEQAQRMSSGIPQFIDERCDFDVGPELLMFQRRGVAKVLLGATKEVEVCCQRRSGEV